MEEGTEELDSGVRDVAYVGEGGDGVNDSGSGDVDRRGEGVEVTEASKINEEREGPEGLAAGA